MRQLSEIIKTAAKRGDFERVEQLLLSNEIEYARNAFDDVERDESGKIKLINKINYAGTGAAEGGYFKKAEEFIQRGANVFMVLHGAVDADHISFVEKYITNHDVNIDFILYVDGSLCISITSIRDEQAKTLFLSTLHQHELPTNDRALALLYNWRGMELTYFSTHFHRTTDELFGKIMTFITQLDPSFDAVRPQVIQLVDQYANAPDTWTAPRSPAEMDLVVEQIGTESKIFHWPNLDRAHVDVSTIGHADHGRSTLTSAFTRSMAENFGNPLPFDQAIDVNRYQAAGIDRNSAEKLASANATISHLMHSIFSAHGITITPTKNDFDKAWEFYNEAQFENALACISKFKREELDSNPYPFGHEKAASVSKSLDTYRLIANCYRHLHRYNDALSALDQFQNVHHNVLSPAGLEQVAKTAQEWEREAQEYANTTAQVLDRDRKSSLAASPHTLCPAQLTQAQPTAASAPETNIAEKRSATPT